MNPTLHTTVLIGLALVLVSMFGPVFYLLAIKDRPIRPVTPMSTPTTPSLAAIDGIDKREACGLYPDHVFQAAYDDSTNPCPLTDKSTPHTSN
ncbi:hypothetical protein ACVBGC_12105 [Burkholderia stagnalis]